MRLATQRITAFVARYALGLGEIALIVAAAPVITLAFPSVRGHTSQGSREGEQRTSEGASDGQTEELADQHLMPPWIE
jgi:hypothetical protein